MDDVADIHAGDHGISAAVAAFRRRDFERALAVVEADAGPVAATVRARVLCALGRHAEAMPLLRAAADSAPNAFPVVWRAARTALQLGRCADALAVMTRAAALRGDVSVVRKRLGEAQMRAGEPARAQFTLRGLIDDGVADAETRALLAFAQAADPDAAKLVDLEGRLRAAVRDIPGWSEPQLRLGTYLVERLRRSEAQVVLEDARARFPDDPWIDLQYLRVVYGLAVRRKDRQAMADAITKMDRIAEGLARSRAPEPGGGITRHYFHTFILNFHRRLRDYQGMAFHLEHLLEIDPTDVEVRIELGRAYARLRRFEAAQAVFDSLRDDGHVAEAEINRAIYVHRATGNHGAAVEGLQAYLAHHPKDVRAHLFLGQELMAAGDPGSAASSLLRARHSGDDRIARHARNSLRECSEMLGRRVDAESEAGELTAAEWQRVAIPEMFALRVDDVVSATRPQFLDGLKVHVRVVHALIVREMLTRFGRNRLGYLWAVLQPIVIAFMFVALFQAIGRTPPEGVPMISFALTGVLSFFMFMKAKGRVASAVRSNRSLLFFRQVTPFSIVLARFLLEFLTGVAVFVVISLLSILIGYDVAPDNLLGLAAAILSLTVLGAGLGLILGSLSHVFPAIQNFQVVVSRILFLTSGIWFYANELPRPAREILLINPVFHGLELARDGYFPTYTAHYADLTYVLAWCFGLVFMGLVTERVLRRQAMEL